MIFYFGESVYTLSILAENIKMFRTLKGLTQDELAKKLRVKRSTVSSWENSISLPDIYTLLEIANILNISLIDLIYEKKINLELTQNIDRVKQIQRKLEYLTNSELDDLEFALKLIEERRKKLHQI